MDPKIELRNVCFQYGAKTVLRDIDVHIHAGQFMALLGPSGSGKTTLLKILLGVLAPTQGQVKVAGGSLRCGYVPQIEQVDWNFPATVEQMVWMGLRQHTCIWPWPTRQDRQRIAEALERLEIPDLMQRPIGSLSGGQQQRVFVARALVANPDLLVLDEPTSDMDVYSTERTLHLLADLNRAGQTIIISTHDLNAASSHLPWVVCVNQTVVAQGPPADVYRKEILDRTYRSDLVVHRQDGHVYVSESLHKHTLADVIPQPVAGHTPDAHHTKGQGSVDAAGTL